MSDPTDPAPFRLLNLPQEIQDKIYEKYFEGVKLVYPLVKSTVPSLHIEQTCKKVNRDARNVRERVWPRKLEVNIHLLEDFLELLNGRANAEWLVDRIDTFHFLATDLFFGDNLSNVYEAMIWRSVSISWPNLRNVYFSWTLTPYLDFFNTDEFAENISRVVPYIMHSPSVSYMQAELGTGTIATMLANKYSEEYKVQVYKLYTIKMKLQGSGTFIFYQASKTNIRSTEHQVVYNYVASNDSGFNDTFKEEGANFPDGELERWLDDGVHRMP
ncbi:hypothetical protein LTR05_002467 [Lithohypha guttulata]|uniref:Uncharacterized protein n=1 Tax=Lithohypha guttulata TaxID=1690604 RepID=A0AAN7T2P6_9EURO|nr:hypothetical protein LTR05_002467 [Lithohypha guttulata]